jgi:hypothetical protein
MNIIETTAPISIDNLKKYFEDKETVFLIDYDNSNLKEEKLLTYLSNLEIPCDLNITDNDYLLPLITCYLKSPHMVEIPFLERITIILLLQHKGILEKQDLTMLESFKELLDLWCERLDSLTLYNLYCVNEDNDYFKNWVLETGIKDDTTDMSGCNFVNLLKYEDFYRFYQKSSSTPKYFPYYFDEYVFKGKNLYSYWANNNNPMFLLTFGIASGVFEQFKENLNATPIQ